MVCVVGGCGLCDRWVWFVPPACVSSRPGQSGRCDGYVLEGRELEFYQRKLKSKKGK